MEVGGLCSDHITLSPGNEENITLRVVLLRVTGDQLVLKVKNLILQPKHGYTSLSLLSAHGNNQLKLWSPKYVDEFGVLLRGTVAGM